MTPLLRVVDRSMLQIVALAGALTCGGCQSSRLGQVPAAFRNQHEAGLAVIGDAYHLTANVTVSAGRPLLFTLKSNEPQAYHGKTLYPDFRAYVKPPVSVTPTDVHVNFSVPGVVLAGGWAYLVGSSPMGQTTRVRAVGEGTKIIIEVDDAMSPSVHRVYFVGDLGSSVGIFVPPTGGSPVTTMTSPGTYVEVYADGTWKDRGAYAADRARAAFVRMVTGEVVGAGVK